MSVITQIILINSWWDELTEASIAKILQYECCDYTSGVHFEKIDMGQAGGTKVFSSDVYAGAFNHFKLDQFKTFLSGLEWGYMRPLIVYEEENDEYFSILEW